MVFSFLTGMATSIACFSIFSQVIASPLLWHPCNATTKTDDFGVVLKKSESVLLNTFPWDDLSVLDFGLRDTRTFNFFSQSGLARNMKSYLGLLSLPKLQPYFKVPHGPTEFRFANIGDQEENESFDVCIVLAACDSTQPEVLRFVSERLKVGGRALLRMDITDVKDGIELEKSLLKMFLLPTLYIDERQGRQLSPSTSFSSSLLTSNSILLSAIRLPANGHTPAGKQECPHVPNKIMFVAHPDDELIFGWDELRKNPRCWRVISVTGSGTHREHHFGRAMRLLDVSSFQVWNFRDCSSCVPFLPKGQSTSNNQHDLEKMIKSELLSSVWDIVATHNPFGEYGHVQHVELSRVLSEIVSDERLAFFSPYSDYGGNLGSALAKYNILAKDTVYTTEGQRTRVFDRTRSRVISANKFAFAEVRQYCLDLDLLTHPFHCLFIEKSIIKQYASAVSDGCILVGFESEKKSVFARITDNWMQLLGHLCGGQVFHCSSLESGRKALIRGLESCENVIFGREPSTELLGLVSRITGQFFRRPSDNPASTWEIDHALELIDRVRQKLKAGTIYQYTLDLHEAFIMLLDHRYEDNAVRLMQRAGKYMGEEKVDQVVCTRMYSYLFGHEFPMAKRHPSITFPVYVRNYIRGACERIVLARKASSDEEQYRNHFFAGVVSLYLEGTDEDNQTFSSWQQHFIDARHYYSSICERRGLCLLSQILNASDVPIGPQSIYMHELFLSSAEYDAGDIIFERQQSNTWTLRETVNVNAPIIPGYTVTRVFEKNMPVLLDSLVRSLRRKDDRVIQSTYRVISNYFELDDLSSELGAEYSMKFTAYTFLCAIFRSNQIPWLLPLENPIEFGKVMLGLSSTAQPQFWPTSYILPRQREQFLANHGDSATGWWIKSKNSAGGNLHEYVSSDTDDVHAFVKKHAAMALLVQSHVANQCQVSLYRQNQLHLHVFSFRIWVAVDARNPKRDPAIYVHDSIELYLSSQPSSNPFASIVSDSFVLTTNRISSYSEYRAEDFESYLGEYISMLCGGVTYAGVIDQVRGGLIDFFRAVNKKKKNSKSTDGNESYLPRLVSFDAMLDLEGKVYLLGLHTHILPSQKLSDSLLEDFFNVLVVSSGAQGGGRTNYSSFRKNTSNGSGFTRIL